MLSPALVATRKVKRLIDLGAAIRANTGHPVERRGQSLPGPRFSNSDALVREHFAKWSEPDHVNFTSLMETLGRLNRRPSAIIETGSSAWGTNSSRLFDRYVDSFGGKFWSVDIRLGPLLELRRELTSNSVLSCDDSVRFLRRWVVQHPGQRADLVYLDSWDLDARNPLPAAAHGIQEFFAIAPALKDGALLLVDDTPATPDLLPMSQREAAQMFFDDYGLVPGKGMLLGEYLGSRGNVTKVHHHYQVLYQFDG